MIGAVSIHQPSLGLSDLQRIYQPAPVQPQVTPNVQAPEQPPSLDIQDRASFTTRQGRVPAAQVKLFEDAPQQAVLRQDSSFSGKLAESSPVKAQISQAAAGHNVTRTNLEHSRITAEQVINPTPFTQEKGSIDGKYHAMSHVMTSQQQQSQEDSAGASSNKHQLFKAQQQYQQLRQNPRPIPPKPPQKIQSKPPVRQQTTIMQDMKNFIKDVISPGAGAPNQVPVNRAKSHTVASHSIYDTRGHLHAFA